MDFAFNLSLAAINVAKAFAKEQKLNLSIADSKLLMHNVMMIQSFLSAFGEMPNVFVKPDEQNQTWFELCHGEKTSD